MKRTLLAPILLAAMSAAGQTIGTEQLTLASVKGDPMLGTTDRTFWHSPHADIITQYKPHDTLILKCQGHIFVKGAVRIGLYDSRDSLVVLAPLGISRIEQGAQIMSISVAFSTDSIPGGEYSEDKFVMKRSWRLSIADAVEWVRSNNGKLRVIAPTYGGRHYDICLRFRE